MSDIFDQRRGTLPLVVSIPHAGTRLPTGLAGRFSHAAARLPDTDWYVDRMYGDLAQQGIGLIRARYSRYVVDLNRPPDDAALYRQPTPGLVPERTFAGDSIYRGAAPDAGEIAERVERYWLPYHRALEAELVRLRAEHGFAVLFDAHSIRSRVPSLFEGRLPDFNLGSYDGRSASAPLVTLVARQLASHAEYSHVVDGRFRGGYITRHYGRPSRGVHALQLEMSQAVYMREDPPQYNERMAEPVKSMLGGLLARIAAWKPADG